MDKCPKCGSKLEGKAVLVTEFECGSIAICSEDISQQTELCKDIAFLRERVVWLEKWREVVLGNLTYLFSRSLFWTATNARVFDESAQELMEAKQ